MRRPHRELCLRVAALIGLAGVSVAGTPAEASCPRNGSRAALKQFHDEYKGALEKQLMDERTASTFGRIYFRARAAHLRRIPFLCRHMRCAVDGSVRMPGSFAGFEAAFLAIQQDQENAGLIGKSDRLNLQPMLQENGGLYASIVPHHVFGDRLRKQCLPIFRGFVRHDGFGHGLELLDPARRSAVLTRYREMGSDLPWEVSTDSRPFYFLEAGALPDIRERAGLEEILRRSELLADEPERLASYLVDALPEHLYLMGGAILDGYNFATYGVEDNPLGALKLLAEPPKLADAAVKRDWLREKITPVLGGIRIVLERDLTPERFLREGLAPPAAFKASDTAEYLRTTLQTHQYWRFVPACGKELNPTTPPNAHR